MPIYHPRCSTTINRDLLPPLFDSYHKVGSSAIVDVIFSNTQLEITVGWRSSCIYIQREHTTSNSSPLWLSRLASKDTYCTALPPQQCQQTTPAWGRWCAPFALSLKSEWVLSSVILLAVTQLDRSTIVFFLFNSYICRSTNYTLLAKMVQHYVRGHSVTKPFWLEEMPRRVFLRCGGGTAFAFAMLQAPLAPPVIHSTPIMICSSSVRLGNCIKSPPTEKPKQWSL